MKQYPLIKKWLGLDVHNLPLVREEFLFVGADDLEAKLAKGFEIYFNKSETPSRTQWEVDTHIALAIGKQPMKKKTKEEAALDLLQRIVDETWATDYADGWTVEAKEILEMEKD